jgi:general secretion pathway protein D
VRVLSQLLGLPLPPPRARPRRSFSRQRRAGAGFGYDGAAGAPPEAPPRVEPASTGTAAAIPLEAPVRVTADPATNALIVSATPADWRTLAGVIRDLDVRRRQVFVEAIILEVTADKLRALGVEFRGAAQTGSGTALGQLNLGSFGTSAVGTAATDPTSLAGLLLAAASNQLVTLPSGAQVPAYTLLLTALQRETDVNVLSAPNIATTDNEEAEIVVGRNVPFVASRATSSSNLSNLFTTIERHDVGITLRMTPQIIADDYVRLTLFEEVSDIDPTATDVGDPNLVGPTTTVRSASTVVAAHDGQTVVIGGLISDTRRASQQGVPFLSDVPVLGNLFRRTDDRRVKTNLLVFLTPHVVSSDTQMAARARDERRKLPPRVRDSAAVRDRAWAPPDGHEPDTAGRPSAGGRESEPPDGDLERQ